MVMLLTACEENTVEPVLYGAVTGTVFDARTNLPLSNVAISTNPATGSYVTDAQGRFSIDKVPVGTVGIIARKADYSQQTANVTVAQGQTLPVALLLEKPAATTPPSAPVRPAPAPMATNQPTDLVLSWHPANATKGDSLRYDVLLFESNNINQRSLLTNSRDTTVQVTDLLFGTTYYWQVTVRNPAGATARGPVWSFQTRPLPDNRFLYARTVAGNTDVYSSNATGTDLVRLTTSAAVETAPQLSPNRDFVAYASNATGQYQLYTMSRDGSNQRRITTLSIEGYHNAGIGYRWSPDGAQLIYAHYNELYRINRDGTGLALLATAPAGRHFRECDWTVQGNRLVVQTVGVNIFDAELYLMNADGSNPTLLVGNLPGRLDSPSFSLDGQRVMYTRDVAGFDATSGRQIDAHIFTQRLDGTGMVDVSQSTSTVIGKPAGTNDLFPRFSPDSFHIIFVNVVNDDLTLPDIWTADLDGRNRTRLFTNATLPDWK
jgi:TolB protein